MKAMVTTANAPMRALRIPRACCSVVAGINEPAKQLGLHAPTQLEVRCSAESPDPWMRGPTQYGHVSVTWPSPSVAHVQLVPLSNGFFCVLTQPQVTPEEQPNGASMQLYV